MTFPLQLTSYIDSNNGQIARNVILHRGLTILLGPNGSGKTNLLRGLKNSLNPLLPGKHVRFLSAGRMGPAEAFRSNSDGFPNQIPQYDNASYGHKNDANRRHTFETITGDFQTLALRIDIQIKIQERLKKLFKRDLLIEWDGGILKIFFARSLGDAKPYSSGREASGLMHLVAILSALYDDEVGALLLDEPEVSLHPQLQAFLLGEIVNVAGFPTSTGNKKIIVIATHSTEMIQLRSTEDLLSLVFCRDLLLAPIQISESEALLQNKKVKSLITRLGQEHKLSLFSDRPLLVEGPSDVIICSAVSSAAGLHLEAAGSQLLPVIGKGQMPTVAKLMRLFGKSPVTLTDADTMCDGAELINSYLSGNTTADVRASTLGFSSAMVMSGTIYSDFSKLVELRWDEISPIAELHSYWINRSNGDTTLAKRRSTFCVVLNTEDPVLDTLNGDGAWVIIKNRLIALLDILEQCGLFVLRKGTIESYYLTSDQFASKEKPSAAVDEVENFHNFSINVFNSTYADILRCVRYAANSVSICESEALQDLLLSIVAPAHARFKGGDSTVNYDVLARSILGDRAKLFRIEAQGEQLLVSLESKILDVTGFPLKLKKEDDVFAAIRAALNQPL